MTSKTITSESIKQVFVSHDNILIIAQDNGLWIMGNNKDRRTGLGANNQAIYSPAYTGINLEDGENIKKFYANDYTCVVYTTSGKIYLANHQHDSSKINQMPVFEAPIRLASLSPRLARRRGTGQADLCIDIATSSRRSDSGTDEADSDQSEEKIDDEPEDRTSSMLEEYDNRLKALEELTENCQNEVDTQCIWHDNSDNESGCFHDWYNRPIQENDSGNNIEYFNYISYSCKPLSKKPHGFYLLCDNVDQMMVYFNSIFFQTNGKLYYYDSEQKPIEMVIMKKLSMSCLVVNGEYAVYYQLVPPFDVTNLVFCENFIYTANAGFHHILSVFSGFYGPKVSWIYFQTQADLPVDPKKIYYNSTECTIYLKHDNDVYKYIHQTHSLKRIVTNNSKSWITWSNDGDDMMLFYMNESGFYIDDAHMEQEDDYHVLIEHFVDMNSNPNSNMYVIDSEESSANRYIVDGIVIFVNIHGLKYYKLYDNGLVYFDQNNTLYLFTTKHYPEQQFNAVEIEKITTADDTYYIYMFNGLPSPVDNLLFTNNLLVVESNKKYYFHTINTEDSGTFSVDHFTEITIENIQKNFPMVIKQHVIRQRKIMDEGTIELSINVTSNKFDKLLTIMEFFKGTTNFEINFKKGTDVISYGDGPKREFMESAIIQFAENYLVRHNVCTEFNLETMSKFTDDDLVCIGSMLHVVITHSMNPLPIRLPLNLLKEIKGKNLKSNELEYFAKAEDPEVFATAHKYCSDADGFLMLDTGYESYPDFIKFMCKYNCYDPEKNKKIEYISRLVASGFNHYNGVKNLSIMNYPTLDYYLSGDYVIDRDLLINKLVIRNNSTFIDKETIVTLIKNLSEEKLAILLKNWSGTSVVKKSYSYIIDIISTNCSTKNDIYFGTCGVDITLSENLLKDPTTRDLLVDILTTPIVTMVD